MLIDRCMNSQNARSGRKRVLVTTASLGSPLDSEWCVQESDEFDIVFDRIDSTDVPIRISAMHPRLQSKIPKMLAWETNPGFDYYVWVDSFFWLLRPDAIESIVASCHDVDACFFRHSKRSSVREELAFIQDLIQKGDESLLQKCMNEPMAEQVAFYLADPGFTDSMLLECGVFVYSARLVENRLANVLKEWFYQNCRWSVRDQLSLPYVLSKYGTHYGTFDFEMYRNPYVAYRPSFGGPGRVERLLRMFSRRK
jgi:hypothetical protein